MTLASVKNDDWMMRFFCLFFATHLHTSPASNNEKLTFNFSKRTITKQEEE